MKKSKRSVAALLVIASLVLSLGACSSDSTQRMNDASKVQSGQADSVAAVSGGFEDEQLELQGDNDGSTSDELSKQYADEASKSTVYGNLKVHFIDVGQGDSVFIELPNGETMLIDAGPTTDIVPNYVKAQGYEEIDYVVATHPDADHINGMPEVLGAFQVGTFYMPEKEHTTQIFDKMLDAVSDNGCIAEYAVAGKNIINSDKLKVYFVGPTKIYSDNNACSAVVKLEYKDVAILFTGDAEYSSENDMISTGCDLSADILKIGHHGSSSSTSEVFLKAVKPKDAVISVGAGNSYGHPNDKVLTLLGKAGINIYRTDEAGTIVIDSDGETYTFNKSKSNVNVTVNNNEAVKETAKETVKETVNVTVNESTAAPPVSYEKQEIQTTNNSAVVYRTKTGEKYHNQGCSYLKSSIETTVAEAKSMGLTPCSRCNPPQ